MRYKRFFLLCSLLLLFFLSLMPKTAQAITQTEKDLLLQQIEILKQEVSLLQMLLANLQSASDPAGITAQSYLAVNLSDYSVVLEKNQNQPYPIASVAKLMNAVVALENIDKTQTITLTEEMLKPLGSSPSLFRGLTVGAENLLKASLIQSTNDAAEALAYAVGKEKFTNLMNQKAKELGMSNTVFYDTHGLNLANLSTASDLAKLISYIRGYHPEILSITRDNNFWLPDATGRKLKFQNVNNFYPLPAFIGGKAGYLPEARQTLAAVFNVNGDAIVVVVLHSINRQADTFRILNQLGREKLIASRMIQNEKA